MENSYLYNLLTKYNIILDENKLNKFEEFKMLLLEWNKKINLTRITEENEIYIKHFVDSLIVTKYINENDKIIDVGTGAGFPGIPLKIFFDNSNITLLDSVNKKLIYLKDVSDKLELKNLEIIHGRAEDIANKKEYREIYDVAISRAVANMSTLVEYLLPFVKIGGRVICMKGPNILEELENSKNAIKILGGKIEKIEKYILPEIENEYNLIIIKKETKTPNIYPRKAGIPSEKPIK